LDLEYFSFIEAISSLQLFSNQVWLYKYNILILVDLDQGL
jgi:hypothetical protein